MKFELVSPSQNFSVVRWASPTWEIGIHRVMFGHRVCGNRLGSDCYAFSICCGPEHDVLFYTMGVIKRLLESCRDDESEKSLTKKLPFPNHVKWYEPEYKSGMLTLIDTLQKDKLMEMAAKL